MMERKTLIVVGAGASCEYGLPSGAELTKVLSNHIDFSVDDFGKLTGGDRMIRLAIEADDARADLLEATRIVRKALPLATSIDNLIHVHRANSRVALVAKMAIARAISTAEKNSSLYAEDDAFLLKKEKGWLTPFFQLMAEGSDFCELKIRLKNLSLVVFNYDRCIEHFLLHAVCRYFNVSSADASDTLQSLEIIHPYGEIAPIPWQDHANGVRFGDELNTDQLRRSVDSLRTFTEGMRDSSRIREALMRVTSEADIKVFIGFAFHDLNMRILYPHDRDVSKPMRRVIATAFEQSDSNTQDLIKQLSRFEKISPHKLVVDQKLTATRLFQDHWRALSLSQYASTD